MNKKEKKLFGIPDTHTLIEKSYKQSGYLGGQETWVFEEYDDKGKLVGEYRQWDNMKPNEAPSSGWERI